MALATPNQLYRLNKLGRLEIAPDSTPMTHVDADRAIKVAEGTWCESCDGGCEDGCRALGFGSDGLLDGVSDGSQAAQAAQ